MKKFTVTLFTLVTMAILLSVSLLSWYSTNSRNATLTDNLAKLKEEYSTLQQMYYWLLGNYSSLEWNYTRVLMEPPSIVPNPGGTGTENESYLDRLEALQNLYNSLRIKYDKVMANYNELRTLTDQRLMRGNVAKFIVPSDPAVLSLVYNITGKRGNVTDPNVMWKDIKSIYDWVDNNIKYREDGLYPILPYDITDVKTKGLRQTNQMIQYPNETLALGMGDCEDIAVLLTSIIRAYFFDGNSSYRYTVECIWITGSTAGHVAVQVPFTQGKLVILDPIRDYFSHDTLGQIALNSASTEIYNWMNIWRPSLGNDIHVYRVFSDYMDQFFDTTNDYLEWMYQR
ncbi:MAG: hypothetical protein N3D85_02145 [Candidatus Bathyarchaeota archaeon]|nr:hypothetical protein [Candidatus Bathyarchaeota archaeon]